MKGYLSIEILRNGVVIDTIQGDNLIVDSGKDNALKCLIGTDRKIVKIQAGVNNAQPQPGDTIITSPVDLAITSTEILNGILTVNFTMGQNIGNNQTYSEFGLICSDGSLFSRKIFTPFLKLPDLSFNGKWKIKL